MAAVSRGSGGRATDRCQLRARKVCSLDIFFFLNERTPRNGLGPGAWGGCRGRARLCAVSRKHALSTAGRGFLSDAGCHAKFDIKLSERKQKVLKIASLCSEGRTLRTARARSPPLPRRGQAVRAGRSPAVLLLAKLAGAHAGRSAVLIIGLCVNHWESSGSFHHAGQAVTKPAGGKGTPGLQRTLRQRRESRVPRPAGVLSPPHPKLLQRTRGSRKRGSGVVPRGCRPLPAWSGWGRPESPHFSGVCGLPVPNPSEKCKFPLTLAPPPELD